MNLPLDFSMNASTDAGGNIMGAYTVPTTVLLGLKKRSNWNQKHINANVIKLIFFQSTVIVGKMNQWNVLKVFLQSGDKT